MYASLQFVEPTNQVREWDDPYANWHGGADKKHVFLLSSAPSMIWLFIRYSKTNCYKCKVLFKLSLQDYYDVYPY